MQGILATTSNEKDLAAKLYISNNTLRKNISILEEKGFIKVERLKTKPGGASQHAQKVYKLGRWVSEDDLQGNELVKEFLYVFDILIEDSPIYD
jgi:predicted ArsR family transcriptional regulator